MSCKHFELEKHIEKQYWYKMSSLHTMQTSNTQQNTTAILLYCNSASHINDEKRMEYTVAHKTVLRVDPAFGSLQ